MLTARFSPGTADIEPSVGRAATPLGRCVDDVDRFRSQLWGRRSLLRPPAIPVADTYADLLSLRDVDTLLTGTSLRVPMYRLVNGGTPVPEPRHTRTVTIGGVRMEGVADPAAVLEALDDGATLVLQGLQRYWPPLGRFVRELEMELGHPCQVNAYLTPPGAQGLAVHSDEHDVLVLQVHGSKSWEIHPAPAEPAGSPREVVLRPGACLYLPEGTPHAARAQEQFSLHLTIGILTLTWRSVLEAAVRRIPPTSLEERLPLGFPTDDRMAAVIADRLAQWGGQLAAVDAEAVHTELAEDFATTRPRPLGGNLLDRVALPALDDTTLLRRRPGALAEMRPAIDGDDRVRLLIGDRELRLPARIAPAVAVVAARTELRPGDLADLLSASSRLVLVRRLVREGLLEVVPAGGA